MKRLLILAALLMALPVLTHAQQIVLEEDIAGDSLYDTWGPNELHFLHFYNGLGFVIGPGEGDSLEVASGFSYQFSTGLRYKLRVSSWYAMGLDLQYRNTRYRLAQDSTKNFPNNALHKREAIVDNAFELEYYNRFNIGRRGNVVGNYVDIGVFGSYGFAFRHRYVNKTDQANPDGAKVTRVVNRQLNYMNPVNYGVKARLGFSMFSFYGRYRISNIVKKNRGFGELPRLMIGIEIGVGG